MAWAYIRLVMICAWAALWPVAGGAATMNAVYTGTVGSGFDAAGLFGAPGTDLAGTPFTLTFSYDTDTGFRDTSVPGVERLWGGAVYPGIAPAVTTRFTLNGQTQVIAGNYQGFVSQCAALACGAGLVQHLATDFQTDPVTGVSTVVYASVFKGLFGDILSGNVPSDLTQPYSLRFDGVFHGFFDYFFFDVYDPVAGYSNSAFAYLNPTRLVVSQVVPIPVPAGGVAMLGLPILVLVGLRLRHRATRGRD